MQHFQALAIDRCRIRPTRNRKNAKEYHLALDGTFRDHFSLSSVRSEVPALVFSSTKRGQISK